MWVCNLKVRLQEAFFVQLCVNEIKNWIGMSHNLSVIYTLTTDTVQKKLLRY